MIIINFTIKMYKKIQNNSYHIVKIKKTCKINKYYKCINNIHFKLFAQRMIKQYRIKFWNSVLNIVIYQNRTLKNISKWKYIQESSKFIYLKIIQNEFKNTYNATHLFFKYLHKQTIKKLLK